MAGSQTLRLRGGRFAVALAVSFLTSAGGARAQNPSPPLPPAGMPAASFAEIVDTVTRRRRCPGRRPSPGPRTTPPTARHRRHPGSRWGLFDTITESIFGQPDPDSWRPLPLSTLFSEGWNEAWVPSPNGSGGAPRQGWINAADGNLYRGWFFTFAQGFNDPPKGNAYLGSYTLMTPLSRRLMLITNVPFVLRNNAESGLPIIDPTRADGDDVAEPHGIRRHLVHAPRLAARDEGLLAHGRARGADPDRQPAPRGEDDRPDPGRRLLEQLRGRLGDPGRDRCRDPDRVAVGTT